MSLDGATFAGYGLDRGRPPYGGVDGGVPVVFITSNNRKHLKIPRLLPEDKRKCYTTAKDVGKYGAISTGVAALIAFLGLGILAGVASPVGVPFTATMIGLGVVAAILALIAVVCLVVYGIFNKKLYL